MPCGNDRATMTKMSDGHVCVTLLLCPAGVRAWTRTMGQPVAESPLPVASDVPVDPNFITARTYSLEQ